MSKKYFQIFCGGFLCFLLVLSMTSKQTVAQDWRLSANYSIKSFGLDYVPNRTFNRNIGAVSKGIFEVELERYLFYRFYLAGKAEMLVHNQKGFFVGGPINFNQFNLGAVAGLQFPKIGVYGGVKLGSLWDLKVQATNFKNSNESWVLPEEPAGKLTAGFTAGIKYYLLNFVRIQAEVNQTYNLPQGIRPQSSFEENPAFRSFDFSPLTFSVGVSIGFPWSRPKRSPKNNDNITLPPLLESATVNFSSPLEDTFITSQYGPRWNSVHQGLDLHAGFRDKILAAEQGVVVKAGKGNGYGKMVRIKHGNGFETLYAHMSTVSVKEGDRIKKGDVIGKAGNTGTSSGVHLHFEIIKNGKHVNPLSYLRFQ